MFQLPDEITKALQELRASYRVWHQRKFRTMPDGRQEDTGEEILAEIIDTATGQGFGGIATGRSEPEAVIAALARAMKSDRPRSPGETISALEAENRTLRSEMAQLKAGGATRKAVPAKSSEDSGD